MSSQSLFGMKNRITSSKGYVCLLESSFFLESEFQESELFSDV
jgi:hypothetical protein